MMALNVGQRQTTIAPIFILISMAKTASPAMPRYADHAAMAGAPAREPDDAVCLSVGARGRQFATASPASNEAVK